jgi:hypothetical protein
LRPLDFLLPVLLLLDFFEPLLREVELLREDERLEVFPDADALRVDELLRDDELLRALPLDFFDLDFFFVATCTSCVPMLYK